MSELMQRCHPLPLQRARRLPDVMQLCQPPPLEGASRLPEPLRLFLKQGQLKWRRPLQQKRQRSS